MSAAIVEARAVRKAFGRTEALRGTSIAVDEGEVVAVTGPSGSGKSTLLLSPAGVLRPEAGEIWFDGRNLTDLSESDRTRLRRREFGLVLQFGQLVPELTAGQNVALPLLPEKHEARRGQHPRPGLARAPRRAGHGRCAPR
ncbi:ATP-binding cassette domain-containing protein [Nocardioides sp. B-3]|uniref:ATP-binding cassette domain-containing protein n=1 Tax=Nocardioides sp. B-3 TaxID=2895565 RepID=UPI00215334E3|nr:ATP-binding cassette domain-containing protein [Nocardioides sp. B-3]UUZ57957.1 ATP-binding cassette domain-containing protein [Nocardioides sp. B-3]